jgi:energy-coupling factor transporter ATP-binding protein EcfA2
VDGLRKLAVIELVRGLTQTGTATVVVTHDMDFAAEVADVVTTMASGQVLHDRGGRELLASRLFFVSQVGLAFGCVSVAEAAALLERSSPVVTHA